MTPQSQRQFNNTPARKRFWPWLAILLTLFYVLFPVYWMINNLAVLSSENFAAGLNSLLNVSSVVVRLTLLFGAVAAYALGWFRGPGLLRYTALTLIAFPPLALLVGLHRLFTNPCGVIGGACREPQLYNTPWPLIIAYLLLTLPLTVWFLVAFFRGLPVS